jgi:SAM-dependent methyltransferase
MELSTRRRLAALNAAFYAAHAEAFGETRPRLAPGVRRVLARIAAGARVLEVGCGDGKVGRALARVGVSEYVGVDASAAMLGRAQRLTERGMVALTKDDGPRTFVLGPSSFVQADLLDPAWLSALPAGAFDWVLAFAVLHHLPGEAIRARVLGDLARRMRPNGTLAMSNWQPTRSERLRGRCLPWSAAGLAEGEVEPGDYLLAWERGGESGMRYVHELREAEARRLAAAAGLRVREVFSADGATGDLAEYAVMQP